MKDPKAQLNENYQTETKNNFSQKLGATFKKLDGIKNPADNNRLQKTNTTGQKSHDHGNDNISLFVKRVLPRIFEQIYDGVLVFGVFGHKLDYKQIKHLSRVS